MSTTNVVRTAVMVNGVRHLLRRYLSNETPHDGTRHVELWCGHNRVKPFLRGWVPERNVVESGLRACWRCEQNAKAGSQDGGAA